MKILFTTLKKTLFWSYERGSWQYDLMCVLILAFVFLAPNSLIHPAAAAPVVIPAEELGAVEPSRVEPAIRDYLKATGHDIQHPRIEIVTDRESGKVTYIVQEK
ncbi:MAG TPA: hypothetical protein VJ464_18480 [Blastocatellia bacterium]|nr:hypothetical protein [Blastocatellia bacterium]